MFDPYHKWLGIPPGRRPPTHYQLLGISPAETDLEVIEEAFIRQTTHLRTYQNGPHALECTRLLNELAQAHVALIDLAKRQAYDAELEEERAYVARAKIKPYSAPIATEQAAADPVPPPRVSRSRRHYHHEFRRKKRAPVAPIVAGVVLLPVVIVAAVLLFASGADDKTTSPQQLAERGSGVPKDGVARQPEASRPPPARQPETPTDPTPPRQPPEEEESKPPERRSPPPNKPDDEGAKPPDRPMPPPGNSDDKGSKPPDRSAPPPSKPDDKAPPKLAKVDLLKLVTPLKAKHVVKGRWRNTGKALVSPLDENARVQIPYEPPEEYDLRVVVERKQGDDTVCIGLVLPGGSRTFINIDAGPSIGYYSGLQGIDGVSLIRRDEAKVTGPLIGRGQNTILCQLRRQEVTLSVNNREIVRWAGDYQRLICGEPWEGSIPRVFILGTWKTSYQFAAVELTPISGEGKALE